MQIIPFVAKAVASVLIKVGVSKAIAVVVGKFVVGLAISGAMNALQRAFMPKPGAAGGGGGSGGGTVAPINQGQEIRTKIDPAFPREVMIGRGATGGSLAYENVSGTENEYLWRVIALSDCEIDAIEQVWGNGVLLTFSGDWHTDYATCTSHFKTAAAASCLWVRIYKGTADQVVDPELAAAFPSEIDANFRGRGVAYAIVKMQYDPDAWAGGAELMFVGRGALCRDPRTSTSVWTNNLALITGQFLRGFSNNGVRVVGLGCAVTDVPDAELSAAADECDEAVALAAGGTEPRYAGGGMISGAETARAVLINLCGAMSARHVDRGGEVVILPGVARTPILHFTEADLLADEPISYAGRRTADERVNAIVSTFVSPADAWQQAPLPVRKNATAIVDDTERLDATRAYRYITSKTQGERVDEIELRAARKEGRLSCSAPLWAFELEPGDWVTATSSRWGGTTKTFEVESIGLQIGGGDNPAARCALTLKETATSVYEWSTALEQANTAGVVTQPAALASYVDSLGRVIDWRGLPINASGGVAVYRSVGAPLSSASSSTIAVAAHTYSAPGQDLAMPSATISGLTTDTNYAVFYDMNTGTYLATTSPAAYYASADRYVALGNQRTQTGGGGFTPPPPPPPGGGGSGGSGGDPLN